MAKKSKKQEEESILESSDALASQIGKSEEFVKKNKNLLTYVAVGLVAVVGGLMWWNGQKDQQNTEAQEMMFQAVYYFEADSLDKALDGDGNNLGFIDVIEDYSGTKAANLANLYAGISYLRKGEFEESIDYLQAFSSNDLLAQARAYALIGDANMEMEEVDAAIEQYKKASEYKPNEQFTPLYLMKLAIAHEENEDYESAVIAYDKIIKEFPKSAEVVNAKKYKARAENL